MSKQVVVEEGLLNEIANYLSQLPYREVARLMLGIGQALNQPPPPPPEQTVKEPEPREVVV